MYDKRAVDPIKVLMFEDNPDDILLTKEAMLETKMHIDLQVVQDGVDGMAFLRREGKYADVFRPDLILLDLNLPKKDGRQVLAEIKSDDTLKLIPVVVLTTSGAEEDILNAYSLHANCYITKPVDLNQFINVVKTIEDFWITIVKLPSNYKR